MLLGAELQWVGYETANRCFDARVAHGESDWSVRRNMFFWYRVVARLHIFSKYLTVEMLSFVCFADTSFTWWGSFSGGGLRLLVLIPAVRRPHPPVDHSHR